MTNPFDKAPVEKDPSGKLVSEIVFADWCKMFGINSEEITSDFDSTDKNAVYDIAFVLGAENFLKGFLSQLEGKLFDIKALKTELDYLRTQKNPEVLGKREQEIAKIFQGAISTYAYNETTNHPADILARKEMNCVGASLIGGMLLKEVGITCVLAGGASHSFLIVVTSDDRVFWQDMQDGKEKPELNNQELTKEKMTAINPYNEAVSPLDIVNFANNPTDEGLTFGVDIEHWNKENLITIEPFLYGIERQELINTGFQLTNAGKHSSALEVLEIARQKSPNVADVYLGLAKALRGLGRYEEAIAKCKKALELDPTYSYVQEEMGSIRKLINEQ